MKNQAYLFDFDGTLVDSMPTYVGIMLNILDEYGVKYGDDIVKIITPLGYGGAAEYYRTLGITTPVSELVALMQARAFEAYAHTIPAKHTVPETLRALKARGADLNVLTASPHSVLDPCLKRLGVWDLFTNVWSCEDFATTKADPVIYAMAAEKLDRTVGEVIFVDDNFNAVKTAKDAGMRAFAIFDPSSAEYRAQMEQTAERYLETLADLLQ